MHSPLPRDPIADARNNWERQGWGDVAAPMAAITAIMRTQQILMARIEAALKPYARNLDAWEEPYAYFDRDALHKRLGTAYYAAAVYTPGTRLLNPAALVRGLADSLPAQVQLYENTPVVEAELKGADPFVRTAQGRRIRAGPRCSSHSARARATSASAASPTARA